LPVRSETGTDGFSKGPFSWRLDGFQLVGHESTIRGEDWLCLLGPSPSQGVLAGYRHASRNFLHFTVDDRLDLLRLLCVVGVLG